MVEISLKTYLDELESLLENEALEEAIGHCKHILNTYPKHLATYRLLGKALLERRRHQDAADVFQRVLSAEPRDFISHAGMSIVYEEQDQINEAIWHMERAFEQEPNNPALQEELRRLYSRTEGYLPPKAQLTTGALATQHARGQLYIQALAELRKALADQPDRMDLQTLQCECLWLSGQKKEAGEAAAQVLERLPNNLVANRVLGELWLGFGRAREAEPFLARVEALDPYLVLEIARGGEPVDREAVQVPRLEWTGAAAASLSAGAPDWVAAVGEAFSQEQEGVPDWAQDLDMSRAPTLTVEQALDFDMADLGKDHETPMPDWMGDLRADAETSLESASPFAEDWAGFDAGPIETALPEGDLPDLSWMQELGGEASAPEPGAPGRVPTGLTDQLEDAAHEEPDWLREFTGSETDLAPGETDSAEYRAADFGDAEAPDWLTGGDLGAGEKTETAIDEQDWLAGMMEPGADVSEPSPAGAADWFTVSAPDEAGEEEEVDWLARLTGPAPEPEAEAEMSGVPDWLGAAPEAPEIGEPALSAPGAIGDEATLAQAMDADWLEGMQEAMPGDEGDTAGEEIGADWLAGLTGLGDEAEPGVLGAETPKWTASLPALPGEGAPGMEQPKWTAGLPTLPEESGRAASLSPTPAEESAGLDTSWMAELSAPPRAQSAEPAPVSDETPDWLTAAAPAAEAAEEAAGMDWLTGAVEASEAEAEEAGIEPGEVPDWLTAAAPAAEAAEEAAGMDWLAGAVEASEAEAEEAEVEPGEVPDWLTAAAPAAEAAEEAAGMDWLAGAADTVEAEAEEAGIEPGEVPDWLTAAAPAAEAAEEAAGEDWLAGAADVTEAEEAEVEPGEVPDWLTAAAPAAEAAEEAAGMDWLAGAVEASEAEAEEAGIEPGEIPDWLSVAEPAAEAEPEPVGESDADWLAGMTESAAAEVAPIEDLGEAWSVDQEAEAEVEIESRPTGLTDWLVEAGIERREEPEAAPPGGTGALADVDGLDWLTAFEPDYDPGAIAEPAVAEPEIAEEPEAAMVDEEPEAEPDFLTALFASAEQSRADAAPEASVLEEPPATEPAEGIPDWLAAVTPKAEVETAEPETAELEVQEADFLARLGLGEPEALFAEDVGAEALDVEPAEGIPDWLTGVTPEAEATGPEIELAETLPPWLAATKMPAEAALEELELPGTPRWLAQSAPAPGPAPAEEPEIDLDEVITPRWLRSAAQPARIETGDLTPAWMAQAEPSAPVEEPVELEAEAPPAVMAETPALATWAERPEPASTPRVPKARFGFQWLAGPPPRAAEASDDGYEFRAERFAEAPTVDVEWADADVFDETPAEAPFEIEGAAELAATEEDVSVLESGDAGVSAVTGVNFDAMAEAQDDVAEQASSAAGESAQWLREPYRGVESMDDFSEAMRSDVRAPEWLREARESAEDDDERSDEADSDLSLGN